MSDVQRWRSPSSRRNWRGSSRPRGSQCVTRQPPPRARPVAAPQPPGRPVWGPDNRPGVHDVFTWDQVLQLEWIIETPVEEANLPATTEGQLPKPKNWVAPWSNGDFVFPSYAQEAEDAADGGASDGELD